jgi:hypothetical protein
MNPNICMEIFRETMIILNTGSQPQIKTDDVSSETRSRSAGVLPTKLEDSEWCLLLH